MQPMKQRQRCCRSARRLAELRPANQLAARHLRIGPHAICKDDQALLDEFMSHLDAIEPLFTSENAAWQVTPGASIRSGFEVQLLRPKALLRASRSLDMV